MTQRLNSGLPTKLPNWLGSRLAIWAACVPAMVVLLLAAGFVWYERGELRDNEHAINELYARTLEGQINQTLSSADLTLQALARQLQTWPGDTPIADAAPLLGQPLATMPYLRSISLLDSAGLVLASSNGDNVAVHLSLDLLKRSPQARPMGLAAAQSGRDLEDGSLTSTRRNSVQSWVPLTLPIQTAGGQIGPLYLVAALNPDYFSNQLHQQLDNTARRAALVTLEGQLIAATDAVQAPTETALRSHIAFSSFLPSQEHGSYHAPGLDERMSLGSFRTTRQYPWVILVELPESELDAHMRELAQPLMLAALASLALIAALALLAWRSLQAYERGQQSHTSAQRNVAERRQELDALIHGLPALAFRIDVSGELQFVNQRRFFQSVGTLPVLGMKLHELLAETDRPKLDALLQSDDHAELGATRLRLDGVGGKARWIELRLTPVVNEADGTIAGFIGLAVEL